MSLGHEIASGFWIIWSLGYVHPSRSYVCLWHFPLDGLYGHLALQIGHEGRYGMTRYPRLVSDALIYDVTIMSSRRLAPDPYEVMELVCPGCFA
jgi:hypothetical protein